MNLLFIFISKSCIIISGKPTREKERGEFMEIISFLVALFASTIGAISGIGGGIIIKPVMDVINVYSVETVSFLSGCTVLTMAISSYIRGLKSEVKINYGITVYLAIGASVGGFLGKQIFDMLPGDVGRVQSVLLLIVNLGVLLYLIFKKKITTRQLANPVVCLIIGLLLGTVSSFLGVGGGPINIAVLSYFFSMGTKETAKNSLFIILFSQVTSLGTTIVTNSVPTFDVVTLGLMCLGGVSGAMIGAAIEKKTDDRIDAKIFQIVLLGLIALNLFNIFR